MEHQTHQIPPDQSPVVGQTIEELETVGRAWADHGLRIGAAALQTSALTLAHTANVLVNIATGLNPSKK